MLSRSVKITSKGQVTIPKKIREILGADNVYFEIEEDNIIIRSVRDVGGLLSEYAKNVKQGISFDKIRDMAWEEVVREKAGKKSP